MSLADLRVFTSSMRQYLFSMWVYSKKYKTDRFKTKLMRDCTLSDKKCKVGVEYKKKNTKMNPDRKTELEM